MLDWFIFGCLGRLVIYLAQGFPKRPKGEFWDELFECDLCLGVWVYSILALIFKIDIFTEYFGYASIVGMLLTGMVTSFIVHLLKIGWNEKFSIIVME